MEWAEKEFRYSVLYRTGRQAKDLYRYIPEELIDAEAIDWCDINEDGYWIYLNHEGGGWVAYDGGEDCGTIHEFTVADLKEAIKTIRRAK